MNEDGLVKFLASATTSGYKDLEGLDFLHGLIVDLNPHLNLISGINGSGKSKLLSEIEQQSRQAGLRVAVYSPSRSIEIRKFKQSVQEIFSSQRKIKDDLKNAYNRKLEELSHQTYPPFSDIVLYHYHEARNVTPEGVDQITILKRTVREFNNILRRLYSEYQIVDLKLEEADVPDFVIKKFGFLKVTTDQLSVGETESISLAFQLYEARDEYDVFLIDEPEIHLNWSFEKYFFDYLNWFAKEYDKQIVVATHSMIVFEEGYKNISKFLEINRKAKHFAISSNPTSETIDALRTRVFKIVNDPSGNHVVFVEDHIHKIVIETLAKISGAQKLVDVIEVHNAKGGVESAYKLFASNSIPSVITNVSFLTDGDNQPDKFPGDNHFIKLAQYDMEGCLMYDLDIVSAVLGVTKSNVQSTIKSKMASSQDPVWKTMSNVAKTKIDTAILKLTSGKPLLKKLIGRKSELAYAESYLQDAIRRNRIGRIFGEKFGHIARSRI